MSDKTFAGWSLDDLHQYCYVRDFQPPTVKRAERWLDAHADPDDDTAVPAELLDAMKACAARARDRRPQ